MRITTGFITLLPLLVTLWVIRLVFGWMRDASQWVIQATLLSPAGHSYLEYLRFDFARWERLNALGLPNPQERFFQLVPSLPIHGPVLAVLGMAAFFVGSVRAPLTGIVLISELTCGYLLLFPICISSLAAYLSAEAVRNRPIYDALLEADLARSGHGPTRAEPRTVYIKVQRGAPLAHLTIAKAGLPHGCLITAVERSGLTLIPTADTLLLPGDHVSILAPCDRPEAPLEIVRLCTGL